MSFDPQLNVFLPGLIIILASTGLTSVDDLKQLLVIGVFASNTFGENSRGTRMRGWGGACSQLLVIGVFASTHIL